MSDVDGTRLEREISEAMRRRDPGPAPIGLRDRVARVPQGPAVRGPALRGLSRAVVPVLGVAAVIALLLLTIPLFLVPGSGPGPGASVAPVATFDPYLRGPGITEAPPLEADVVVPLGLLLLGVVVFAFAPRGPRRAAAALVVLLALGFGGALVLLTHANTGPVASSGGVGVLNPDQPAGSPRWTAFITAAPREPYSFGFSVENDGPLTIHLDGIVASGIPPDDHAPTFRAAWTGTEPNGGIGGPAEPFAPVDLPPGGHVLLWLVGVASECAAGPAFDPSGSWSAVSIPDVRVRYSILGIPRTATIRLPYDLMQPYAESCPPQP